MIQYFRYKSLLIYSQKQNQYNYNVFNKKVNLIHGPNTAGKSTLLQSLIYVFGINDVQANLTEILNLEVFFRLDLIKSSINGDENICIIRENGTIYIKREKLPVRTFHGIDSDNTTEHIKLKSYFHDLFAVNLFLEAKDGFKLAPIEVIFLPYYISQAVGWVYLRKSFSSLDYYRNFKDDFLDYYLGIESATDREKKKELEGEVARFQKEALFFQEMERSDNEIQVMKISDESFTKESLIYLRDYSNNQKRAAEAEKQFLIKSNELSYLEERKSVISRVKRNHEKQRPLTDSCPVCDQLLPGSFAVEYAHLQEENDTIDQLDKIKQHIKKVQSDLNTIQIRIEKEKALISDNYRIFQNYAEKDLSMESWLNQKATIQLEQKIKIKLGEISIELGKRKEALKRYKTEEQVEVERKLKSRMFAQTLSGYISQLGVKTLEEDRFTSLYKITTFPTQGVELLKTVMAYHFALNNLISNTPNIHRLPFVLDAVFKEDVTDESKDLIIKFIAKNHPKDTQLFFSVAEESDKKSHVKRYNKDYFDGNATLILIGDGETKRSLLKEYDNTIDPLIEESLSIINNYS